MLVAVLGTALPGGQSAAIAAPALPSAATCRADTGPYQWQLEQMLKLPWDGAMSQQDCLAIQRVQKQLGIKPANGAADQKTYRRVIAVWKKHGTVPLSRPHKPPRPQPARKCRADTGPYQWQLEQMLKLPWDGAMSQQDCLAIQRVQKQLGIKPANGAADQKTYRRVIAVWKKHGIAPPSRPHKPPRLHKPPNRPHKPPARPHQPPRPQPARKCGADTGPYQWQLERRLHLPQDGTMSQRDCRAIQRLQRRLGIKPAKGAADQKTYRLLLVDDVKRNPNFRNRCPARRFRVTCVDLSRQVLWVQKGRRIVFGPVPIRSGRNGLETRTGWQRVYQKRRTFFSTIYDNAPMPYSQFFNGGQAMHGTYHDLFESGSGGCINMYVKDARQLFRLLKIGDSLFIYGRKPPTRVVARPSDVSDDALIAEGFGSAGIPITWDLDTPLNQP